jgi:plastocyanin
VVERILRIAAARLRRRLLPALVASGLLLWASAAFGHGPTVKISYGRVVPKTLTVNVGQVVHFQNVSPSPNPVTVVADDGSFESPTLARAEGWHHTFETPGRYDFHVAEFSSARGSVIVAEP